MPAEHPFSAAYSPRLICVTEAWRDALARLCEGLGARERILLVTGDAGTGKTTLLLEAASRWDGRARVVFMPNPALTRLELLEEFARRLGAEPPPMASKPQLLGCLETALAAIAHRSQAAVLVIEDAHQLADDAFDELRLLVNSETQAGRSLELVFVGLPALVERMATPALAAIGQRDTARLTLEPLSNKGTRRYLYHRVEATGGDPAQLFPRPACTEIHARSHGVPRAINAIASEAMRLASEAGSDSVTPEHVRAAARKPVARASASVAASASADANASVAASTKRARASQPPVTPAAPCPSDEAVTELIVTAAPHAPSEPNNADPRVSEWVSRFVGSQGPPRIGAAIGFTDWDANDREADSQQVECEHPVKRDIEPLSRSSMPGSAPGEPVDNCDPAAIPEPARKPMRLIVLDDLPEDLPSGHAPRSPMPPVRHRGSRSASLPAIAASVFVVAALGTVIVLSRGRNLLPHPPAVGAMVVAQPVTAAAAPMAVQSSAPIIEPVRTKPAEIRPASAASTTSTSTALQAGPEPSSGAIEQPAGTVATAPSRQRLALDVGSYIDADRARLERDHLIAQTGLRAWIVDVAEVDGRTYRIFLGVFSSQERADASATTLLERGLISEARVVPLPSRRARH